MRVGKSLFENLKNACEEAYPYEACGVLAGEIEDHSVTDFRPVENAATDEGFDVYRMDPVEQLHAFDEIEEAGLDRVGFYHSHPDHDAYFSERDTDRALIDGEPAYPGEEYLVLSVRDGEYVEAEAFAWDGKAFVETGLDIL